MNYKCYKILKVLLKNKSNLEDKEFCIKIFDVLPKYKDVENCVSYLAANDYIKGHLDDIHRQHLDDSYKKYCSSLLEGEFVYIGIDLKEKALNYKFYRADEIKAFFIKSIFVPIFVSVLTTLAIILIDYLF